MKTKNKIENDNTKMEKFFLISIASAFVLFIGVSVITKKVISSTILGALLLGILYSGILTLNPKNLKKGFEFIIIESGLFGFFNFMFLIFFSKSINFFISEDFSDSKFIFLELGNATKEFVSVSIGLFFYFVNHTIFNGGLELSNGWISVPLILLIFFVCSYLEEFITTFLVKSINFISKKIFRKKIMSVMKLNVISLILGIGWFFNIFLNTNQISFPIILFLIVTLKGMTGKKYKIISELIDSVSFLN